MKTKHAWIVYMILGAFWLPGAEPEETSVITERGPHHRVTEKTIRENTAEGEVISRTARQVDLATGLHYREGNEWVEAQEFIEPHPNGAVFHHGQIKCAFANNLNSSGAIRVVDPEGRTFTTHPLGLMATDAASGNSVSVASIKDCVGQIVPPNRIVYANALEGAVKGDIIYVVSKSGFEQFVRITEAPNANFLADNQISLETARLETITEVMEAPGGEFTTEILKTESDPTFRGIMALPDFVNQIIDFGSLRLPKGKAIDLGGTVSEDIPVGTTWEVVNGRTFIIEAIEWAKAEPAMQALPQRQAKVGGNVQPKQMHAKVKTEPKGANSVAFPEAAQLVGRTPVGKPAMMARSLIRNISRPFPLAPVLRASVDQKPMKQLAMLDMNYGLLLDYSLTLNGGLTNYLLRPEATYKILSNSTVTLYGTSTIMGGTVVKYERKGALEFVGTVNCDTTPYHPAVFMSADDSSMGESVGSGSLSGYYAAAALRASTTVTGELHDLRISGAQIGIEWHGVNSRFYNLQFINCSNAIRRTSISYAPIHNALMTNVFVGFSGTNVGFEVQHLTVNRMDTLANLSGSPATLTLTNAILYYVTNAGTGTVLFDYIATNTAALPAANNGWPVSANDFEAAVGGYHYLTNTSSLHDAGTTIIRPALASELHKLTTYAPILLTGTTSSSATLSPNALRDNDQPDLGYHYPPLDYIMRNYRLNTNVVLIMTNGVAVGIDYNGSNWGLIFDTATNICIGIPTNMNRIVRAHNVQERSTGNPGTRAMLYDIGDSGTHGNSDARYRFTEFSAMSGDGYGFYTGKNWKNWEWSHSWIYNLSITLNADKGSQVYGVTNVIFEWADATFQRSGSSVFHLRNNLFRNHNLNVAGLDSASTLKDSLFDRQIVYTNGTTISHDHNAYYLTTNNGAIATYGLPGVSPGQSLGSLTYNTDPYGVYGSYGRYYQPSGSPLLVAGSITADNVGLYHFTCLTNQYKASDAWVNIGPHYVALNQYGALADYDSDGLPDYYEDCNGTGYREGGETDWQDSDTDDDGVPDGEELLLGRNALGGTLSDTNNLLNLRVYTPLK